MEYQNWTEELSSKIRSDRTLLHRFHHEPDGTVATLIGKELEHERQTKLVEAVKINVFLETVSSLFRRVERIGL